MENVIFNELIIRGYSVDAGVVEYRGRDENGKDIRSWLEVDFISNLHLISMVRRNDFRKSTVLTGFRIPSEK